MYERELTDLQSLIGEWSRTGKIDVGNWSANEIMTILSGQPEFREKVLALLECRLGEAIQ